MTMTGAADLTAARPGAPAPGYDRGTRTDLLAVRVFGPLTVIRGGRVLPLRSDKQRRLLALLALHRGRAVPREQIARTLWDSDVPDAARTLIHTYLARLRALVGTDAIVAESGGYRLALAPGALDLLEFEALAERGAAEMPARPEAAWELFDRALMIARGTVLADLAEAFAAHPVVLAVTRQQVAVALAHADCALRLGRPAQSFPSLQGLSTHEPQHDAAATRLLHALAASGRHTTVIDMHAPIHPPLHKGFTVSSGPGPSAAQGLLPADCAQSPATLIHEPGRATAQRPCPPTRLPPAVSGFVGRAEQFAELDRQLPAASTAKGIAVITGPAGAGKTQLAVQWARRSSPEFPDGLFFVDLQGLSSRPPVAAHAALAAMLRALGVPAARIPDGAEEAAALFRTETEDLRLLIVLDNAHSPERIRPLLPRTDGCAIVLTGRDAPDGLTQAGEAGHITVDALTLAEAVDLLETLLGAAIEQTRARRLARACGCLPLALRIAAAHLEGAGPGFAESYLEQLERRLQTRGQSPSGTRIQPHRDAPDGADPFVKAAFQLSYEALNSPEQELFRLLGLLPGGGFGAGAAAALAGIGLEEAEQRLHRLCRASLVGRRPDGRYTLHDVLRACARDLAVGSGQVNAPVRRLAAWYVAALRAATQAAHPDALRLPDEPHVPVRGSFADADAAQSWLDMESSNIASLIGTALRQGAPTEAWRLAFAYWPHLTARRMTALMGEAGTTALAAARAAGDELGEAASHMILAAAAGMTNDITGATGHLGRAAELSRTLGWQDARAAALNELGVITMRDGRFTEAAIRFRQNIDVMRAAGNKEGEALALTSLGLLLTASGRLREGVASLREALRLRTLTGPRGALVILHAGLGAAYRDLGEPTRAYEESVEAVRIGRETGERYFSCVAEATLVGVACDVGDYARAGEHLARTWELVGASGHADLHALAALHAGGFELAQGRAEAARNWYDRALSYGESAADARYAARALVGIASCERAALHAGAAVRAGARALLRAKKSGHRLQIADAHLDLARAHAAVGGRVRALAHAHAAAQMARECGYRNGIRAAEHILATLG